MSGEGTRDSVLVIDDDPDLRSLVEAVGQIYDIPVLQAPDCCEGLRILEEEYARIKMIFLDYFMPRMDPSNCVDSIIARAGSEIPIVLLTAAVDPAARAAELKIKRWLSKPFDVEALSNVLTQKAS
jgi:CheY-like chemotaxis protein